MNIVLIGYRGTGKSVVGELLAQKLNRETISMDSEIVKKAAMSIPEFVEQNGWPKFRDLETEVARELAGRDNIIVDCGGGVIDIGEETNIGSVCRLGVLEGLSVGHHCVIGDRSCISGASHAFSDTETPIIQQPLVCKGHTSIGDFVTIGERVTILGQA